MRVWFDALGPAEHFFISGSSLGFVNWKWEHFGQLQHFDILLSQGSYLTSNDALCVALWGYHWANERLWAFLLCCFSEVKVSELYVWSSLFLLGRCCLNPLFIYNMIGTQPPAAEEGNVTHGAASVVVRSSLNLFPCFWLTWYMEFVGDRLSFLLNHQVLWVLAGLHLVWGQNHTKVMRIMLLPNASQGLIWGAIGKEGKMEIGNFILPVGVCSSIVLAMAAQRLTSTLGLGLCVPLLINTHLCPCTAPGRFAEATEHKCRCGCGCRVGTCFVPQWEHVTSWADGPQPPLPGQRLRIDSHKSRSKYCPIIRPSKWRWWMVSISELIFFPTYFLTQSNLLF